MNKSTQNNLSITQLILTVFWALIIMFDFQNLYQQGLIKFQWSIIMTFKEFIIQHLYNIDFGTFDHVTSSLYFIVVFVGLYNILLLTTNVFSAIIMKLNSNINPDIKKIGDDSM